MNKTGLKDFIRSEMENVKEDEEFDPSILINPRSPLDIAKKEDERIIDELLAGVPRGQGYYLKLYKELRPNEYEFKLRIDNFESWADLEWEITSIVRSYTIKNPQKWGSGAYRIIVWCDSGLRGDKYKPVFFVIDALESEIINNNNNNNNSNNQNTSEHVATQIETLGRLLQSVQTITGRNQEDPAKLQGLLAESFKTGLEVAKPNQPVVDPNQNQNMLMMTMMTGMMTMMGEVMKASMTKSNEPPKEDKLPQTLALLKELGIVGQNNPQPDTIAQIIKLKELGVIPSTPSVNADPVNTTLDLITKLTPLLGGLGGGNGSPSIGAELIKSIGPQLGGIIGNVTKTIDNVVKYKSGGITPDQKKSQLDDQSQLENPSRMIEYPLDNPMNQDINLSRIPNSSRIPSSATIMNNNNEDKEVSMFGIRLPIFNKLKTWVDNNDESKFDDLQDLILSYSTEDDFEKILSGETAPLTLLTKLEPWAGSWVTSDKTLDYVNRFIKSVNDKNPGFEIKCQSCNEVNLYENEEAYTSDPICEKCGVKIVNNSQKFDVGHPIEEGGI